MEAVHSRLGSSPVYSMEYGDVDGLSKDINGRNVRLPRIKRACQACRMKKIKVEGVKDLMKCPFADRNALIHSARFLPEARNVIPARELERPALGRNHLNSSTTRVSSESLDAQLEVRSLLQTSLSKPWTATEDSLLLQGGSKSVDWDEIFEKFFPFRSLNDCRVRREYLTNAQEEGQKELDDKSLLKIATSYSLFRQGIWQLLAKTTGEPWDHLEKVCMAQGTARLEWLASKADETTRTRATNDISDIAQDQSLLTSLWGRPYNHSHKYLNNENLLSDGEVAPLLPHLPTLQTQRIPELVGLRGENTETHGLSANDWLRKDSAESIENSVEVTHRNRSTRNQSETSGIKYSSDINVSVDSCDMEILSSRGESSLEDCEVADLPSDVLPFYEHFRQRLLEGFFRAFTVSGKASPYRCADGENSSQQSNGHANAPTTSSNSLYRTQGHQRKRKRINEQEGKDNGDDPTPNTRSPKPSDVDSKRPLACPYFKYNPARFSGMNCNERDYRGCSSKFLPDISRLNEFCDREELDEHSQRALRCSFNGPKFTEKMTSAQQRQIKRKRPGVTAEENWFDIYRILFPQAPIPDSPYLETKYPTIISNFMSYFRVEGPPLLSSLLETELITALGASVSTELRTLIANRAAEQCIEQMLGAPACLLFQGQPHSSSTLPDLETASSSQGATSGITTLPSDEVESIQCNPTSQDKVADHNPSFASESSNLDTLPYVPPPEISLPEDFDIEAFLNPRSFDERP
ncbi:MAG: hypothetical protein Q9160_005788 [Pyrenula sp. 1 TL-2023]